MFHLSVISAFGPFVAPSAGYDTRGLRLGPFGSRAIICQILLLDVSFFFSGVQLAPMQLFLEGYQGCSGRLGPNVSECGLLEEGCVAGRARQLCMSETAGISANKIIPRVDYVREDERRKLQD